MITNLIRNIQIFFISIVGLAILNTIFNNTIISISEFNHFIININVIDSIFGIDPEFSFFSIESIDETEETTTISTTDSSTEGSSTPAEITNNESKALDSNVTSSTIELSSTNDSEILARRIGSGLATSALGGVGAGIGLVFNGLLNGVSRNPSGSNELFRFAIFGFALTEAMGLFALMLAFVLLYA